MYHDSVFTVPTKLLRWFLEGDSPSLLAGPFFKKFDVDYLLLFVPLCCAGSIPKELGDLSELEEIWLEGNQLTGACEGQDIVCLSERNLLHLEYVSCVGE